MKIYTKTGDRGTTRIHGGDRVEKDDIRIEANGTLDELNAQLGIVRSLLPEDHDFQKILFRVQSELMPLMSHVATPSTIRNQNPNVLPEDLISWVEEAIDDYSAELGNSAYFILPGGTSVAAHLQLSRTIARRAERRLWSLNKKDPIPENILIYVNRLSDLLFTLARVDLIRNNFTEERWQKFLYKRDQYQNQK